MQYCGVQSVFVICEANLYAEVILIVDKNYSYSLPGNSSKILDDKIFV